jgi:hypothetical protein
MAALGAEYVAAGKTTLFEGLKPFLSGEDEDLSYPELAARLQLNEGALRVALHRLRRGYGEYVRDEIAKLVQRPEDIEDELRHLFAALR